MEWLVTFVLVIFGLVLAYKYLNSRKRKTGLQGPKSYPVFGSALQLTKETVLDQFVVWAKRYGEMFELQLFGTTSIVLNSADLVTKAFCNDGYKQVLNHRPPLHIAERLFPSESIGLTAEPGKFHGDLRKSFTKGLHAYGEGIPRFENIFKTEIHRVMEYIEDRKGQDFEFTGLVKKVPLQRYVDLGKCIHLL